MKPVVIISVFAIVILSVICALFKSNHHSMMGSINDPPDGAAIAGTVFSAVIVYAVCHALNTDFFMSFVLNENEKKYFWPAVASRPSYTCAKVEGASLGFHELQEI
ncbi:Uncharacterized protein GcM1_221067 [Golovinomyces cichoracearum]|uniref:Uncharacterized protein n=1 Tax=Golovinomyces cichoracearum TaxID=62708 RepID=A0A420IRW4_9PEZI|nr:Uncharacterized protein GcM1_221067 [Golovinomyces cichoracearum]